MSTPSTVLQTIKARQDIHDVLTRYCRGADRCDVALMQSCFHVDAWDDHGFFKGSAHEFCGLAATNLGGRFLSTKHYMSNVTIEIDGDKASTETYILGILRKAENDRLFDVTLSARYLDRFECRNDAWKIAHRLLVSEGTRVDPVVEEAALLNQGQPGSRGMRDPSYAFLKAV